MKAGEDTRGQHSSHSIKTRVSLGVLTRQTQSYRKLQDFGTGPKSIHVYLAVIGLCGFSLSLSL